MDIKLKNKDLKLVSFIWAICLIAISLSAFFNFQLNRSRTVFNSYYESVEFTSTVSDFFNKFVDFNVNYKDYTSRSIDEKLSPEEVENRKAQYDNNLQEKISSIENQYAGDIDEAEKNGNKDRLNRLIEERNKKLEEVKKENTKTIDDVKKELAAVSDTRYQNLKKEFENMTSIKYYIKDTKTDKIYTNLSGPSKVGDYIKYNSIYSLSFPNSSYKNPRMQSVNSQFAELALEGYLVIPQGGNIAYSYSQYNRARTVALIQMFAVFICLAAGIYLLRYSKKRNIDGHELITKAKTLYHKLPFDIGLIIFVFALLIAPELYGDKSIFQGEFTYFDINFIISLCLVTFLTFYFYISIPELIKIIKNKREFAEKLRSGMAFRLKDTAFKGLKDKTIVFKVFIFTIAFGLISGITAIVLNSKSDVAIVFIILYIFLTFIFVVIKLHTLDKTIKGTREIVNGNLGYTIEVKGKGNLAKLAHNINNMKLGISKAVENQMKSDRLKSELITNVSHDLKTPLTSIINYVDLLKREELTREEMQDYIGVLDRKTQRLKVLIEDLFEASKMASGAVELNIEKVDVAQLLNQSLAELDEKIKTSSLIFRVNIPHHKVYANLDGKKTWRVFENLIGNILKYSQPNTRVYIELIEGDSNIIITMKNISAYEMDFNVEEIFERFKRGDASRSTEGSGLGLAIAKSIVDIQGGRLNIETDGDLFKVIIEFNK